MIKNSFPSGRTNAHCPGLDASFRRRRWWPLLVLVVALAAITTAHHSRASTALYPYIYKHRATTITPQAMQRLRQYDPLVRYFTSLSYFRPRHKVSADFVRALILAESSAQRNAVSPVGALGLTQIMPATGRQAAQELYESGARFRHVSRERLKNLESQDLLDPAINILIASYLIAKYNEKFNGRIELVVSAWNAGEFAPALAAGRHAPYEETKNLIGRVNSYYLHLQRQKSVVRR